MNINDAMSFATMLKATKLKNNTVRLGSFLLEGKKGVHSKIQYNEAGLDMLDNAHQYTFKIFGGELQLSLQLYLNTADHYRLFAYTRMGKRQGMTFSVNLTTEKENAATIFSMLGSSKNSISDQMDI